MEAGKPSSDWQANEIDHIFLEWDGETSRKVLLELIGVLETNDVARNQRRELALDKLVDLYKASATKNPKAVLAAQGQVSKFKNAEDLEKALVLESASPSEKQKLLLEEMAERTEAYNTVRAIAKKLGNIFQKDIPEYQRASYIAPFLGDVLTYHYERKNYRRDQVSTITEER